MLDVFAVTVAPPPLMLHTVPVPVSVHVADPIVSAADVPATDCALTAPLPTENASKKEMVAAVTAVLLVAASNEVFIVRAPDVANASTVR